MKLVFIFLLFANNFIYSTGHASQKVAAQALAWLKCPPKNPFILDTCLTQWCSFDEASQLLKWDSNKTAL
ncbi:MAG: hypothetical protein ACOYL6_00680 [Bacteriovoracaceae bacterium]